MKKFLRILGILLGLLVITGILVWQFYLKPEPPAISDKDRAQLSLMPLPAELELTGEELVIDQDFGSKIQNASTPRLEKAVQRFYQRLAKKTGIAFEDPESQKLLLACNSSDASLPHLESEEGYAIKIASNGVEIRSDSDIGMLHALETLWQLAYKKDDHWVLPGARITDAPRYPWRGLMIDVSRHWIPKEVILRNIDAMAAVKMNVLHWHLSDYQGFRVESKTLPRLHELGSNGNYYTQEEVKEIIAYAAERGIRVVPEFDVPGHATSWLVGYPELGSAPGPYKLDTVALGVFLPVMNPANPDVYSFLETFIKEMSTLFPDLYVHIGGDEVNPRHWLDNEDILKFMEQNQLSDPHELQAYFNRKLRDIIERNGKKMMGWDEIQHPELPSEGIVVQSWRNHSSLWESARRGNKAILSTGYYLDHKKSAGQHYQTDPEVIRGALDIDLDSTYWSSYKASIFFNDTEIEGNIYLFGQDPEMKVVMDFMEEPSGIDQVDREGKRISFSNETDFGEMKVFFDLEGDSLMGKTKLALFDLEMKGVKTGAHDMVGGIPLPKFKKIEPLTEQSKKNILGGEACMWTEMVDSITLESRIWPRAAAIAEKLWSPRSLTQDSEDMYRRLMTTDSLLESLGLLHRKQTEAILEGRVPDSLRPALRSILDYLQEGSFLSRMDNYDPVLYTHTPLNQMVDAVGAESLKAYAFNQEVENWAHTQSEESKSSILNRLEHWITASDQIRSASDSNPLLQQVLPHVENLGALSRLAQRSLHEGLEPDDQNAAQKLLTRAEEETGGIKLAVVPGMRQLIQGE